MPVPKCWDAERCTKPWCKFAHPGDLGYEDAPLSRLHKDKIRDSGGAFDSRRDSGYTARSGSKRSDAGRSRTDTGWGDSRRTSGGGGWSPELATSKGRGASPTQDFWGASGSSTKDGGSTWGNDAPQTGGGGWGGGTSTNEAWGTSAGSAVEWGEVGRGNSDSASRTSAHSSPTKLPPSSPRGHRNRSPVRPAPLLVPGSHSGDRDRGRARERDSEWGKEPDRSREIKSSSPSRHSSSRHHSPLPSKPSSSRAGREKDRERDRSLDKRRESVDTRNAMDIDLPRPPVSSLFVTSPKNAPATEPGELPQSVPTPTNATMPMPPPPLPLGAVPRPLGAAALPHVKAPPPPPPPQGKGPMLPPPPPPQTAPAVVPAVSAPVVKPQPVPLPKDVPLGLSEEWIGLLDTLLQHRRTYEHLKHQIGRLEQHEKHRTIPNPTRRSGNDPANSLDAARSMADHTKKTMQSLLERFALSMSALNVSVGGTTSGKASSAPAMVEATTLLVNNGEEALSQVRLLADDVSKMQSELKLVEAEVDGIFATKKDMEKLKGDAKGMKEDIRKEGEARGKELSDVRKDAAAAKTEVGTVKLELEGMKLDVGNAYRGLGETKQEILKIKAEQEMTRAGVEKVEQELADVQKERGEVTVEVEQARQELGGIRKEMGRLRQAVDEVKQEMERLKKKMEEQPASSNKGKRDRNVSVPATDAMDVDDEPRLTKRARLSDAVRLQSQVDASLVAPASSSLTQDIGGPSNRQLKELHDALHDYVAMLESEVAQINVDVRERLDEFGELVGWEPKVYSGNANAGASTRAESAPPVSSPMVPLAGEMRSSAPPAVSPERIKRVGSRLVAVEEDLETPVASGPSANGLQEGETLAKLRRDLDATMEQLLAMWAAKGPWPEIVGKNLNAALGVESVDEVWERAARVAKDAMQKANVDDASSRPEVNGMKHVNGNGGRKEESEAESGQATAMAFMKSVKAEQTKMMEEMRQERAKMQRESEELKREREGMRTMLEQSERERNAIHSLQLEQKKLLVEVQSVLEGLPKPGNAMLSPNEMTNRALQHGAASAHREVTGLQQLAVILPSLLKLAGVSTTI